MLRLPESRGGSLDLRGQVVRHVPQVAQSHLHRGRDVHVGLLLSGGDPRLHLEQHVGRGGEEVSPLLVLAPPVLHALVEHLVGPGPVFPRVPSAAENG